MNRSEDDRFGLKKVNGLSQLELGGFADFENTEDRSAKKFGPDSGLCLA